MTALAPTTAPATVAVPTLEATPTDRPTAPPVEDQATAVAIGNATVAALATASTPTAVLPPSAPAEGSAPAPTPEVAAAAPTEPSDAPAAAAKASGVTTAPVHAAVSASDPRFPCQPGQIKANRESGIYQLPGQQTYAQTEHDVACSATEAQAQAAGYRRARR